MSTPRTEATADRQWLEGLRRKAAERRVPVGAMLELTSVCNLRCVHCYLGSQDEQHRQRAQEMDTDRVLAVLRELADAGCLTLILTGGDPMVRRDFPDIYCRARELGMFVTVFCDGILVNNRILALFRELPPRLVEISLYGATPATYEKVTRVPGSFDRAMEGILRLREAGIRVGLKTVLMTLNQHELQLMEGIAESLGLPFRFDGAIFPCLPDGDAAPLTVRLTPEALVAHEMADSRRRRDWVRAYDNAQSASPSRRVYSCGAGRTSLYIDPLGRVSPCLMTTQHRFSLNDKPLRRLWDEDIAEVGKKEYKEGDSGMPEHLRGACSHCPGVNHLETGSEAHESAFVLEVARLRHKAILQEKRAADQGDVSHGA